jgi:hypothetical protein
MVITPLQETYEQAAELPPEMQSELAEYMRNKIAAMWDEKWEKTLASPESIADSERMRIKIEADIASGRIKDYFTDDDLEKLF